MKHLIFLFVLVITPLCYAQNTGLVVGKIMDAELNNSPLVMAEVSLKNTSFKTNTDLSGQFIFENLEAGDYTLVYSFVGYETKEVNIHVDALNPVELKLSLEASQVSMDDIALAMAMANAGQSSKNTSDQ